MEKIEGDGLFQVAEADEVFTQSLCGYEMVGMYQEQHAEKVRCKETDPKADYAGYTTEVDHLVQVTKTFFVMRENKESAVASLHTQIETLREEVADAQAKLKDAETQADERGKRLAEVQERWDESKVITDQQRETIAELTRTKQKMEEDIGKIRQAIGTVKMDEILAVEE